MAFGYLDTEFIDFPPGIDAAYLRSLTTASGLEVPEMLRIVDAELRAVNEGIDELVATMMAPRTAEVFTTASRGDRMTARRRTEYDTARPQYVERRGHMLSIDGFDIALGVTEDGLQEISLEAFRDQARAMREGWEATYRQEALIRLFDPASISVDANTAVTSPGFAGSGTGDNVFSGTFPDGGVIDTGTYTHYFRDEAADRALVVKTARNVIKRWFPGPFTLVGSQTFIDALVALGAAGGFVSAGSELIRQASDVAEATVSAADFVGVFDGDIMVRQPIRDITADYAAVYKSFGSLNRNNPLIMRYNPIKGPNVVLRSREMFPLANAISKADFGMNVNNRVAASLIKVAASGAYDAPTIS